MTIRWIVLLLVAASVTACDNIDHGRCLEDHLQVTMMPVLIGKTMIMQPRMQNVCDRWEYPEGRPA